MRILAAGGWIIYARRGASRCPAARRPSSWWLVTDSGGWGGAAARTMASIDGGRPVTAWPEDSQEGPWTLP
jgi:hypothetical protein